MVRMSGARNRFLTSIVLPDHVLRACWIDLSPPPLIRAHKHTPTTLLPPATPSLLLSSRLVSYPRDSAARITRRARQTRTPGFRPSFATPSCASPNGLSLRDWKSPPSLRLLVTWRRRGRDTYTRPRHNNGQRERWWERNIRGRDRERQDASDKDAGYGGSPVVILRDHWIDLIRNMGNELRFE